MSDSDPIPALVKELADKLRLLGRTLATVESCTGGLLGAAITGLSGISDVYCGGFVTYSDSVKALSVGVSLKTLESYGAVSKQVASEMSIGGCRKLLATNSVAITGIAGPDGGSAEKPIGTVWICSAQSTGNLDCRRFVFPGDRACIRSHAVVASLSMVIQMLNGDKDDLEHERERLGA